MRLIIFLFYKQFKFLFQILIQFLISKVLKPPILELEDLDFLFYFKTARTLMLLSLSLSLSLLRGPTQRRTCLTNNDFRSEYALPKLLIDVHKRNLWLPALFADKIRIKVRIKVRIQIIILAKNSATFYRAALGGPEAENLKLNPFAGWSHVQPDQIRLPGIVCLENW